MKQFNAFSMFDKGERMLKSYSETAEFFEDPEFIKVWEICRKDNQ